MSGQTWRAIRRKHIQSVPKGSSFDAYQRAVREASEEYRGRRNPAVASNPTGGGLLRIAVIGAAALWLMNRFGQPQARQ